MPRSTPRSMGRPTPRSTPLHAATRLLARIMALLAGLATGPLAANDSEAGLSLGGLEFLRNSAIELVEEDLLITPEQVRVRYLFRNVTDQPVDILVAFPMPPLGYAGSEGGHGMIPHEGSGNLLSFRTRIDGAEIVPNVETRARLLGLDVTARLRELEVPLVPWFWDSPQRIAALPDETRAILLDEMLIDARNRPLWTLETSFWRRQTFPALSDVVVEHSYRPVRGGSAEPGIGSDAAPDDWLEARQQAMRARYCIEPEQEAAALRQLETDDLRDVLQYTSSDVGYVLHTGANWRGPIQRFRLRVETEVSSDFAFLCFPGLRRLAGNRLEAELEHFWPDRDLEILFLHLWSLEHRSNP